MERGSRAELSATAFPYVGHIVTHPPRPGNRDSQRAGEGSREAGSTGPASTACSLGPLCPETDCHSEGYPSCYRGRASWTAAKQEGTETDARLCTLVPPRMIPDMMSGERCDDRR